MKNTERKAEEQYLQETRKVILNNLGNYGNEVARMQGEIDEMLEHYHDNDVELWTILNNTITMNEHMKRALERNERAVHKPYFGRIIFRDENLGTEESLYIGKGGIAIDSTHMAVIDWRAPVANAYYENGLGKCSYTAPEGKEIPIDLKLKRTFEIEEGTLLDYYDTEIVANDDLLMKYLSRSKEAVLGEIVATIQKEQNEIIRKSPYHNLIVQGVAGSGKTTVAMHRISFILYNYQERFKPDDFYIVGSNRILLNYITGVLPDLDVYGVRQMTMEQLFIRLLYEDWDEKKYRVRSVSGGMGAAVPGDVIKGTEQWYLDLEGFIRRLEWDAICRDDIFLDPRQFVEGIKDGRNGIYDRREEDRKAGLPERLIRLSEGAAVERYIRQNPSVSVQNKINMLNERLIVKIKDEFLGKEIKYTEEERKAILKAYRGYYGSSKWKTPIYEMYHQFLAEQRDKGLHVTVPTDSFDVYDLAALALIYKRVRETEVISEAHHIVIDEAQDYGMMAYCVLHACIRECTYTIMGDVSQNIHFGYGLSDWEALRRLLLPDPMDSFGVLQKSYRNTVEISGFATNILRHGSFSIYPVEPIIRHGNEVAVEQAADLGLRAAGLCRDWQEKGLDTIAVVCRDATEAGQAAKQLSRHITILESDLEKADFGSGILVLPVEYTKGLEFDAVLIWNPSRKSYPVDDGHAKLLYVAATRALHELHVLYQEELTGLIADPVPETADTHARDESPVAEGSPDIAKNCDSTVSSMSGKEGPGKNPSSPNRGRALAKVNTETVRKTKPIVVRTTAPDRITDVERSRETVSSQPEFGDMPATGLLRVPGHAKANLGIKWSSKQPDGLYLQSQYGILRISPVTGNILRLTFTRRLRVSDGTHPLICVDKTDKNWRYRENGKMIELSAGEVVLQADKLSGAIRFLDTRGTLLLAERKGESRLLENSRSWLFLDWQKGEQLFAMPAAGKEPLRLRGSGKYFSTGAGLPFILSDRGYALLPASTSPSSFCCDIPAYGSYLYTEGEQQDYYFIAGKQKQNLLDAYAYLCGQDI